MSGEMGGRMKSNDKKRLDWAHSVRNDPGASQKNKRAAEAIISRLDPDFWRDEAEPFSHLEWGAP